MKVYIKRQNVRVHKLGRDTICTEKDTTTGNESAGIPVDVQISGVVTITTLGLVDDIMMHAIWFFLSALDAQH